VVLILHPTAIHESSIFLRLIFFPFALSHRISNSMGIDIINTTLSVLGTSMALFLFLSPGPTMSRIIREESTLKFSADVFLISMINCYSWTIYALPTVTPERTALLVTNGAGLLFFVVYSAIFLKYASNRSAFIPKLVTTLTFLALLTAFVYKAIPSPLWFDSEVSTAKQQSEFLGITAAVFNIVMYGAPLSTAALVVSTKSVEFMPLMMTLGSGACSTSWLLFGLYCNDIYLIVPTCCGCILSLLQVILYAKYMGTPESLNCQAKASEIMKVGIVELEIVEAEIVEAELVRVELEKEMESKL
jgi:solute carrier family 50 protein (sugar transporter)